MSNFLLKYQNSCINRSRISCQNSQTSRKIVLFTAAPQFCFFIISGMTGGGAFFHHPHHGDPDGLCNPVAVAQYQNNNNSIYGNRSTTASALDSSQSNLGLVSRKLPASGFPIREKTHNLYYTLICNYCTYATKYFMVFQLSTTVANNLGKFVAPNQTGWPDWILA